MVGRESDEHDPVRTPYSDEVVVETKAPTGNGVYSIDLKLHRGEILGLGGLVCAGCSELTMLLFGAAKKEDGGILLGGHSVSIRSPYNAIMLGIGLIPEDRKLGGVFLEHPINWNISIMSIGQMSKGGIVNEAAVDTLSQTYFEKLNIIAPSAKQFVKKFVRQQPAEGSSCQGACSTNKHYHLR